MKKYDVGKEAAEKMGNIILNMGYFEHVCRDHSFKNDYLFYRFNENLVNSLKN
jgi:hypothetical protein